MGDIFKLIARQREVIQEAQPWRGLLKRSYLHDYAKIEIELIESFQKALSPGSSSGTIEQQGFVSRVGGREFIVRPSLSLDYGILCEAAPGLALPTDYEFVRVKGARVLDGKTSRYASNDIMIAEELEAIRLPDVTLAPELSMREVEDRLLVGYTDLPSVMKRSLLTSLVSSPGEAARIGGLTSTLLPIEPDFSRSQYALLEDMRRSIPRDLTSDYQLTVRIRGKGNYTVSPFPWGIYNSSAARWDSTTDPEVFARISEGRSLHETTIGFSAASAAPEDLDEVYLTQADFTMLVDREVVRHGSSGRFDGDVAKFLITLHTNFPHVSRNVDENLMRMITPKLRKVRKDYDPQGFSGMINPDASTGSPRSILSIAKALARADGTDSVTEMHVEQAVTQYVDSRVDLFESWSEMGKDYSTTRIPVRLQVERIGRVAPKILAFLIENPNSTVAEIREAFPKVGERIFNSQFSELKRARLVYLSDNKDERYSSTYLSW